jgi:hypothetical protein
VRGLVFVLQAKIALTVLPWCIPLLLFPAEFLAELGFPVPVPEIFFRLLGMAYLALVLGYWFGLQQLRAGTYPSTAVWVGILSNGGACTLLGTHGFQAAWSGWGTFAQIFMWASLAGTGAITAGLVVFGPCRAESSSAAAANESPAA